MLKYVTVLAIAICVQCTSKNSVNKDSSTTNTTPEVETAAPVIFQDLSVEEFLQKSKADANGVILDVRTPEETAEGVIPGAIELDYRSSDFASQVDKLDKSKTYYVYCRSGGRSVGACEEMNKLGFTNLYNLLGGYSAYRERL